MFVSYLTSNEDQCRIMSTFIQVRKLLPFPRMAHYFYSCLSLDWFETKKMHKYFSFIFQRFVVWYSVWEFTKSWCLWEYSGLCPWICVPETVSGIYLVIVLNWTELRHTSCLFLMYIMLEYFYIVHRNEMELVCVLCILVFR